LKVSECDGPEAGNIEQRCNYVTVEAEFAGVHFTAEALGMTLCQSWHPETDTRLLDQ
jgi:hypothetical protein